MIEEIAMALRNALERGHGLEESVQSFINAGYNPIEVKQAAQSLSYLPQTVRSAEQNQQEDLSNVKAQQFPPQSSQPVKKEQFSEGNNKVNPSFDQSIERYNSYTSSMRPKQKSKRGFLITILVFILILLVGGLIYIIIYGKDILDSFIK